MEASVPEVELVTVVNANYSRMGNCKTIQPLVVLIVKNPFSVFLENSVQIRAKIIQLVM